MTSKAKAERYRQLLKANAVAPQDYDDALAAYKQAAANVQAARINLGYTRITAPISGRIGISNVTEGALVTSGQDDRACDYPDAGPDIRQHSAVQHAASGASPGGCRWPTRQRHAGRHQYRVMARRRHEVSAYWQAAIYRCNGRYQHGRRHSAGHLPESASRSSAGHVCAHDRRRRRCAKCDTGAAAGRDP